MKPDDADRERIKQIVREEFETLRVRGRFEDLFAESIIEKPIPSNYEVMCSILYKDN